MVEGSGGGGVSGLGVARIRLGSTAGPRRLSPRQAQALVGVAEGWSNEEIGMLLGISAESVKTHLRKAYRKLGVAGRAGAVAAGFRQGWLT